MASDEELMLGVSHGSADAFQELFGRYREKVWAFFRRRVQNSGRAEELSQETFLIVWTNSRRYELRAPFRSYLFGIAYKVLANARRERPIAEAEQIENARPLADDVLWVRQALGRLDDLAREVLMLREFENLTYAEMATVLGVPVNTVRSRLFRARTELRRLMTTVADQGAGR